MAWLIQDSATVQTRIYEAQRHAGLFGGVELRAVAIEAARLSNDHGWELLAADHSGERIVGAATLLADCRVADTSRRFDGKSLLVVSGMIAGPYGIAQIAKTARSMGAKEIHAVHLGGWDGVIADCDSVVMLNRRGVVAACEVI